MAEINKNMVIGDVLDKKPAAEKVIAKYFGNACFSCPGVRMESLELGASIHGIDVDIMIKEKNEIEDSE
ncbi:MAG TPA: DUF1858 domain-containing protein [Actinobacteria bacterium]|nr:DUF1858 domain-containing protein [Actinomycetota bacterium]